MKVEIVSKQHINPSSPTPLHLQNIQLSFIDEMIPPNRIPLVIYYDNNGIARRETLSCRLKSSLSDALLHYYPLAGRTKDQALVHCNDEGVLCIEANTDVRISEAVKTHDSSVLDNLIPSKSNGYVTKAKEQLAIQITWFRCGLMAIGICISHRIADGSTVISFIKCWSCFANGHIANVVLRLLNAHILFPPRNTHDFKPNFRSPPVQPHSLKLAMPRFVFNSLEINALKLKVQESTDLDPKPTRVDVLSAFLWGHCLKAKGAKKSGKPVAWKDSNANRAIIWKHFSNGWCRKRG